MDDCKLFRTGRQGTRGSGVVLYVSECYDCLDLDDSGDRVECLWVRIRGKAHKKDILEGVYYKLPKKTEEAEKILYINIIYKRSHNCLLLS